MPCALVPHAPLSLLYVVGSEAMVSSLAVALASASSHDAALIVRLVASQALGVAGQMHPQPKTGLAHGSSDQQVKVDRDRIRERTGSQRASR